ncbi:MAG: hypothetical protein FWC22_06095 [Treponema sp.]|nr:hypothetical protein [Treponema sp.]
MAYAQSFGSVYGCVKNGCGLESAQFLQQAMQLQAQIATRTRHLMAGIISAILAAKALCIRHIGSYLIKKNRFYKSLTIGKNQFNVYEYDRNTQNGRNRFTSVR